MEIDPARLQEIYSRTAAFYDGVVAAHQAAAKQIGIELLARRPGETFLEAGAGTGWSFARVLASTGAAGAVGLDLAQGMIDVARRNLADASLTAAALVLGDATRLPFHGDVFDCLLCTYTLEVLPAATAQAALREMRRVLRPGGRLVAVDLTAGEGDDAAFTADWQRRYQRDPEYFGGARPMSLPPLLAAAGLRLEERRYSGHGAGWPAEIVLATRPR